MLWGSLKFNGPSRFLDEIPEKFYEWNFYKMGSLKQGSRNKSASRFDEFSQVPEYQSHESVHMISNSEVKSLSKYPSGSKVKHKLYGVGSVLETEGTGPDEKIVIMFQDGTRKKFMVKFAPLERV